MSLRWHCSDLQGAFWGLILGLILGLIRLVLDFIYGQPQCDQPDERPAVVKDIHYLYFSMILSTVTLITMSTMSWCTEPPSKEMVHLGSMLEALKPLAASDRKGTHSGLSKEDGLFKKLKSPVWDFRSSLISRLGTDHQNPALSLLLFSGPMWGWQLLRIYPLILTKQEHKHFVLAFPAKFLIPINGVS